MIVGKLLESKNYNDGYNAQTGQYTDLVKAGIIDPAKVVRTAIQGRRLGGRPADHDGSHDRRGTKKDSRCRCRVAAAAWAEWILRKPDPESCEGRPPGRPFAFGSGPLSCGHDRHDRLLLHPPSPWTYLGHALFLKICARHGVAIRYRPIPIGEVFDATGSLPLPKRPPARQRYRFVEMQRWREKRGLPLVLKPKHFPFDATLLNRAIVGLAKLAAIRPARRRGPDGAMGRGPQPRRRGGSRAPDRRIRF